MGTRSFAIAIVLGTAVAWLSMVAFGYSVAFHPFGRAAERSEWLTPLLQVLSWLPFVAAGCVTLAYVASAHSYRLAFVAAASAVLTAVALALHYAPNMEFLEVLSIMWLHFLCPLTLFPVFARLLANE
jgi:hypothetical protein